MIYKMHYQFLLERFLIEKRKDLRILGLSNQLVWQDQSIHGSQIIVNKFVDLLKLVLKLLRNI